MMDANPEAMKAIVAALQEARAFIGDDPQKLVDWVNAQEPIPAEESPSTLLSPQMVLGTRPTDITPWVTSTPPVGRRGGTPWSPPT